MAVKRMNPAPPAPGAQSPGSVISGLLERVARRRDLLETVLWQLGLTGSEVDHVLQTADRYAADSVLARAELQQAAGQLAAADAVAARAAELEAAAERLRIAAAEVARAPRHARTDPRAAR